MTDVNITIQYGDDFGGSAGCMTVRLPGWFKDTTLPHARRFFKLAAQNAGKHNNREEINKMRAAIDAALYEAEAECKAAAPTEKRSKEIWFKRLQGVKSDLASALNKYDPETKKTLRRKNECIRESQRKS